MRVAVNRARARHCAAYHTAAFNRCPCRQTGQDAPQVRLAQDEDVVQALAPHAAEEALAGGVLPRRAVGRAQLRDAARRGDAGEGRPVLAVVVADEVARPLAEGRGLAQLLGDPGVGRVARHADMDDPARAERDDEEGVQRAGRAGR